MLLAIVGVAAPASAYPELLAASGQATCGSCHVDDRGGPLHDAGRAAANALARGGDGRLLHGAWTPPAWLAVGGALRAGGAARRVAIERDFPGYLDQTGAPISEPGAVATDAMLELRQAELAVHVTFDGVSMLLRGGLVGDGHGAAPQLVSRERVLAWRRGALELRAGRFALPWGLGPTSPGDESLGDRALGLGPLDAPDALGVALHGARWHLDAAAFLRPSDGGARGGVAQLWHVASERTRLGAQAMLDDVAGARRRVTVGALATHWLPTAQLLVLAELDVGREQFAGAAPARIQLAWRAGLARRLLRGVRATAALQRWESDVTLRTTAHDALDLGVHLAPWAHVELAATLRGELRGGDASHPTFTGWLTAGYWL